MPDPFTAEERDTIIVHVREKCPSTYLSSRPVRHRRSTKRDDSPSMGRCESQAPQSH